MTDTLDLARILSIWPISESLAYHTSAGDLINLSRTTSTLRSSLHGTLPEESRSRRLSTAGLRTDLEPEVGKHQTIEWARLKSLARFTCSSATHTRGDDPKPCVYCSKPICDACIVRDSFKHPNENTFKNRLRYYCKFCWYIGQPARSHRYPALKVSRNGNMELADEAGGMSSYAEASGFCECTLKDNGHLCLDCKEEQNSSSLAPSKLLLGKDNSNHEIHCYGLNCKNIIDIESPDKDRLRVCLWCQKPLRRQWTGEDRHAWNLKTIEARARNAESRSRDLEEYNRKRLEIMRMSRHELRGTTSPGDNLPIFVRHLDTVNYRNYMNQTSAPDPDQVYKSKNGYWRYESGFLYAVQMRCRDTRFTTINGVPVSTLSKLTRANGLPYARTNREMYPNFYGPGTPKPSGHWQFMRNKTYLNELRTRILVMHLVEGHDKNHIVDVLTSEYGLTVFPHEVQKLIQEHQWQKPPDAEDGPPEFASDLKDKVLGLDPESERVVGTGSHLDRSRSVGSDATENEDLMEGLTLESTPDELILLGGGDPPPGTMSEPRDENNDEPPPYDP